MTIEERTIIEVMVMRLISYMHTLAALCISSSGRLSGVDVTWEQTGVDVTWEQMKQDMAQSFSDLDKVSK